MKGEGVERLKKFLLDNRISSINALMGIYSVIFPNGLPRLFFVIIVVSSLACVIKGGLNIAAQVRSCKKGYADEETRLRMQARKSAYIRHEYGYIKDELKEAWYADMRSAVKKLALKQLLAFAVLVAVCYTNPSNTLACWNGVKSILRTETENSQPQTEAPAQTEAAVQPETERPAQTEAIAQPQAENGSYSAVKKPGDYRFILDKPNDAPKLDVEIEEQVFCFGAGESLNREVRKNMLAILGGQKKPQEISSQKGTGGRSASDYVNMEKVFKDKVATYECEEDYCIWLQKAPHSSEKEAYLQGRMQLGEELSSSGSGDYELWWRLANDYQYYAQEYEAQTDNGAAILYYYSMSIYYCMRALEYEMTQEMRDTIWNYMCFRYQDIGRDESVVDESYKERAAQVRSALGAMQT